MKRKLILLSGVALMAVTTCWGGPGPAKLLARLPAAVRQTIHAQLGDGRLASIEKDQDDGGLVYDVEMIRDGKDRDFTVGSDGTLIDRQVFPPELPAIVQKSIQAQCGKGILGDVYQSIDDGETSYDVEFTVGEVTRNFSVAEDGSLLSREMLPAELPAAVWQTIQKQAGGIAPDEIDKTYDDDGTNYEVDLTQAGRARDFTVSTEGELTGVQLFLNELPAPLQVAIQMESANAKVGDIDKLIDDGDISYEVDVLAGGVTRTITFDTKGEVLSQERTVRLADIPEAVQKVVAAEFAPGQIPHVSEIIEGKQVSYDVSVDGAGRQKSLGIAADGTVLPEDN